MHEYKHTYNMRNVYLVVDCTMYVPNEQVVIHWLTGKILAQSISYACVLWWKQLYGERCKCICIKGISCIL